MEIGMIGLGRMGSNMTRRLLDGDHHVVVYDPNKKAVEALVALGAKGSVSIPDLVGSLDTPRAIWLMVPSGEPTENTVHDLAAQLSQGDVVIDGGNSNYKDSMRRAAVLAEKGLIFLDVGTSGGVWGLKEGYGLMVGGDSEAFRRLEPIFQTLAPSPQQGYGYVGPSGAGHFVKMVHNGIEYGLMQSYAEGFELMQAKQEFNLDLKHIAEIWRYGSVVRSWLLDLVAAALQKDPRLESIQGYVEDSGEGRWTVQESIDLAVPAPVITLALQARFRSRQGQPFGDRLLAALRQQFGGHAVKKVAQNIGSNPVNGGSSK
jgi:6-phosphogluconate dehydrogenase